MGSETTRYRAKRQRYEQMGAISVPDCLLCLDRISDSSDEISLVSIDAAIDAHCMTDVMPLLEYGSNMSSESTPAKSSEKRKHADAGVPDAVPSAEPKQKKQKKVKQPQADGESQPSGESKEDKKARKAAKKAVSGTRVCFKQDHLHCRNRRPPNPSSTKRQ